MRRLRTRFDSQIRNLAPINFGFLKGGIMVGVFAAFVNEYFKKY